MTARSSDPRPAAGVPAPRRIAYGDRPSQFAELSLPAGDGPVPPRGSCCAGRSARRASSTWSTARPSGAARSPTSSAARPPGRIPGRYALGSPAERLPVGVPVICVHGTADGNVPLRQSRRYVERAQAAGDPAELVTLDGADHFAVIDPAADAWRACTEALARLL
jgi:pimeloyl-ACP methyl ester carboxylesterase